jgi:YD repeat-containing protein
MMKRNLWLAAAAAAALIATAAWAAETITYRYDARGRLVKVEHAGTVNNNVNTAYTYDKADNRTNRTTTGAP